ncbi:MAG: DUF4347 domain-containing protein [Nostoc sp. DedQUE05]|uniref:DUF4347 domain-containing protein n=1 Tax=Nostoc sp. DedQUE05 TaxID=3075391 RepID=UPI002AD34A8B|nr:DUF4347 domain-containing protein [Nostoc sp. DedQUE05]MDZ8096654.1 DUF4347 domain-containing protein [Nostoc sp. DedQUE05]
MKNTNIIFIDSSVINYELLLKNLVSQVEVAILDRYQDGVEQITEVLSQRRGVESVHIISHGSPGCLYLGNTQLSLSTLQRYAQELQTWSSHLCISPSLLLYGCNVAAGDAGEEFIEKLHKLTKAGIAASANLTGNAALGGDWNLEISRGEVTTVQIFKPEILETYNFVLASFNDNFANRIVLSGNSGSSTGNNVGATSESGELIQSGTTNSVWWSWTAAASGNVVFDTINSGFDTYLSVYTGNAVNSLSLVADNDDSNGTSASKVSFTVTAGTTYHISVDGYQSSTGNITLNYSFTPGATTSNNAPTLTDTVVTLNSINEDSSAPSGAVGTLVSSLVSLGANVSDSNTGAVTGIAITAANTISGSWWYSTNNGQNWYSLGTVSNSSARLLAADANTRVYFRPSSNFNGIISNAITFRAWDETSGTNGNLANTSTNGGSSAFSSTTDTAAITINAVNDAPVVTPIYPLSIPDNASNGTIIRTLTATDVDGNTTFSNWTIAGGNIDTDGDGNQAFSINPNSGQLAINDIDDLNPQTNPTVNLQVNVSDGIAISTNENITIKLVQNPGDLDLNFGNGGTVTTKFGYGGPAYSVAIQPDGKILAVGYVYMENNNVSAPDFALARYNPDGSLDTSFGNSGTVTTHIVGTSSDFGYRVTLQSDGKIIVGGYSWGDSTQPSQPDFALTRYNADGSLDSSFGNGGKVITNFGEDFGHNVLLQPDGKIILAGYIGNGNPDYVLLRYNTNGSLDTSFGNGGKVNGTNGYAVAIQLDGKIVVGGRASNGNNNDFAITRYNTNGSLDTSFGNSGRVLAAIGISFENIESLAIQSDGKIVVTGYVWNVWNSSNQEDFAIARFNTDGTLDSNFGNGGKVIAPLSVSTGDRGTSLSIQPNGKIVVGGYVESDTQSLNRTTVLLAYNPDGTLDTSFGTAGKVTTSLKSKYDETHVLATQSDGKIVVVGNVNGYFAVARFLGVSNEVPTAPANTAPVLSDTIVTLSAVNENAGAPSGAVGTLISSIVSINSNITDPNSGGLTGIAIAAANTINGTWWYSTNSGTVWNPLGSVSESSARLLVADAYSRIYFQPNANFNGDIANAITFRAWDRTSGLNGNLADTTSNGSTTAFSSATDTALLTVKSIAPVYHQLALSDFSQDWSNTSLITTDDDWLNIPSIRGFRGDNLVSSVGVDPQTVLADGSATPIDVNANQTNPSTYANAGVAEFVYESNPTIALRGSSTATAPHLVFYLNATGRQNVQLNFTLKDIDTSTRNAIQPLAVQYRIGNTGDFINLPAGFVSDASNNGTTPYSYDAREARLSVLLPPEVNNQAQVQIRLITTDANGEDEWIGIDNIKVTSTAISANQAPVATNDSYLVSENTLFSTVAATTALILDSDRGNYIGQSDYYSYTSLTGNFGASRAYPTNTSSNNAIRITYSEPGSGGKWWDLSFAAPFNAPLTTGTTYTGAARFPFQATNQPGLDVSGDGRGYNSLTGEFTINQIIYGVDSQIVSFDATFRENGDGDPINESYRGRIQYNATTGNRLPGVLTNDTDSEKTPLKATLVSGTQNGSLIFNPDGSFNYTPNTGFKGIDTFTYRAGDRIADSNIATVTLKVGVSDAPIISSWPGYAANYTENAAAILITESYVKVTDPDSVNFDNGKLTVRIKNGVSIDDRLAIRNEGTNITQINLNGNIIKYGTLQIGTFSGGIGTEDLVIGLNANATLFAIEALVRNITYVNVSESPSTTPRTIEVVLTDGDGGISSAVTRTINVTAVNDTPTISDLPSVTVNEDASVTIPGIAINDVDAGNSLLSVILTATKGTVTIKSDVVGGLTSTSINNNSSSNVTLTGTVSQINATLADIAGLTYKGNANINGTDSLSIVVNDGNTGGSTSKKLLLTINSVNDAPAIAAGQSFSINESIANGTVVGTIAATDVDGSTFSNWTIINGNLDSDRDGQVGFNINSSTGEITVNDSDDLDFETNPTFELQVTVSDGISTSSVETVTVRLQDVSENTLFGTRSADTLTGSVADDIIFGYEGGDRLYGETGKDNIYGGAGNDSLYGGTGNDILDGGDANDYLYGGDGNDTLFGGSGNDTLDGGLGDDSLIGGIGNDIYTVDSISDSILESVNAGTDLVKSSVSWLLTDNLENLTLTGSRAINGIGNNLNNIIIGNTAANTLNGSDGNDSLIGGDGNDTLFGGSGNDTLDGGVGIDNLNGGVSDDIYTVDNLSDTITEGLDAGTDLVKSSVSWVLADNIENLTLTGSGVINGTGNSLNNILTGNTGANILNGVDGNDSLIGNSGNDTLFGGAGDDTLDGGAGTDNLNGGVGNDIYIVDNLNDSITEGLDATTDLVKSSVSWVLGNNLENLTLIGTGAINGIGNSQNNILTGNTGVNTLNGVDGNDSLIGGTGNDTLFGGVGDDLLSGGTGKDVLTGGIGRDSFYLTDTRIGGYDIIADFTVGDDTIFVSKAEFGLSQSQNTSLEASLFRLGANAVTASDRFIYNQTTGNLFFDKDGLGGTAQVQIAQFSNQAIITHANITVIA